MIFFGVLALHHGLVVGKHVVVIVVAAGAFAIEVGQVLVSCDGSGHCVKTSARLAVAQLLVLGKELLLLVVVELATVKVLELLLLLICFVVVVRSGAAGGEEVGRGAATVGISSKEGGRRRTHCVATAAVAEILIASSKRLAGKCIGRGVQAHLISTVGNTIHVVPLELLLLLLLLRERGRQAALAHGCRWATTCEGRPVDRVAEIAPLAAHHRVLLDVAVCTQSVVL